MGFLHVGIEKVPAAAASRNKKRLLLRTKRRTMVKKLRTALLNVIRMDDREVVKSEAQGYTPFLFKDRANSRHDKAIGLLKARTEEMLNAIA